MPFNLVEMIADPIACASDQRCKFGHRVEDHAVYCQNDAWADNPRKCRRRWYTNGEVKDEDCPGFQPNPTFAGTLNPTPRDGEMCTKCGGAKLVAGDRDRIETCPRCMGDGAEPHAIEMTQFEQDTLEIGKIHSGHPFVCIAKSSEQEEGVSRLCDLYLLSRLSLTRVGNAAVFLVRLTAKGDAVMRANWASWASLAAKKTTGPLHQE